MLEYECMYVHMYACCICIYAIAVFGAAGLYWYVFRFGNALRCSSTGKTELSRFDGVHYKLVCRFWRLVGL